jgi:hypothetical protein
MIVGSLGRGTISLQSSIDLITNSISFAFGCSLVSNRSLDGDNYPRPKGENNNQQ